MEIDDRIREAVARTEVIRSPKQNLYTFGTTNIHYFLVTEPAYLELTQTTDETVIREGRVIAERPRIVTPYYLASLEGFSANARRYFEQLMETYGRSSRGIFYSYRNRPEQTNIVSGNLPGVVEKLTADIDSRGDPLTALIKGIDDMWDVALIRFIYELTARSLGDNVGQLGARGLLEMDDKGVPADARQRIDEMFREVKAGERDPKELKTELDRWGLFQDYEDRFYSLFGK